jgi:23S rRNA A2030 N6-methylase RlmJ
MYDHGKKAGNQGDVVKHCALIAAADALMAESDGVFDYADTFAGYPYNPLRSDGEWVNGIGALKQSDRTPGTFAVNFWVRQWSGGGNQVGWAYPGSSAFILELCRSRGLLLCARLWDTSPAVVRQLRSAFSTLEVDIQSRPAEIRDFSCKRPNLLLIDPPGLRTQSAGEYPDLAELLRFFDVADNVVLWFPITAQGDGSRFPETEASMSANATCLAHGLSVSAVRWSASAGTCGCRLAYRLPTEASKKLREAVDDVAAVIGWHEVVLHEQTTRTHCAQY